MLLSPTINQQLIPCSTVFLEKLIVVEQLQNSLNFKRFYSHLFSQTPSFTIITFLNNKLSYSFVHTYVCSILNLDRSYLRHSELRTFMKFNSYTSLYIYIYIYWSWNDNQPTVLTLVCEYPLL